MSVMNMRILRWMIWIYKKNIIINLYISGWLANLLILEKIWEIGCDGTDILEKKLFKGSDSCFKNECRKIKRK